MLRLVAVRQDPDRLQSMPQRDQFGAGQQVVEVAVQRYACHLRAVPVPVEAARADHGVEIARGERVL